MLCSWIWTLCPIMTVGLLHTAPMRLNSERPRGAELRSVNDTERWCENPAMALARTGFSQHLECGILRSESCSEGSFALIPHPAIITHFSFNWSRFIHRERRNAMFTSGMCLWRRGDFTIAHDDRNVTTACSRHPGHCESVGGFDQSAMLTSYRVWDYFSKWSGRVYLEHCGCSKCQWNSLRQP